MNNWLSRTERLIGIEAVETLKNSKVVILGIGGVGSFTAEALARTGVGKLVLVDKDTVDITNLNRQIHATLTTVDMAKVQAMKDRILDINPECEVTMHEVFAQEDNICQIITKDVDYVVDAIDTITSKIALAVWCNENGFKLISSMGTANKLDPTKLTVSDIFKTKMCPLAKVMRHELRKRGLTALRVVYSEETPIEPKIKIEGELGGTHRKQMPASIAFVPSAAGLIIAAEVVRELILVARS